MRYTEQKQKYVLYKTMANSKKIIMSCATAQNQYPTIDSVVSGHYLSGGFPPQFVEALCFFYWQTKLKTQQENVNTINGSSPICNYSLSNIQLYARLKLHGAPVPLKVVSSETKVGQK
jgi:hypothetical protein